MKRIAILFMMLVLVLTFTACGTGGGDTQPTGNSPRLTAEEALNIALEEAGVSRESIRNLENNLEREDGVLVYEIDFDSGILEYSYDVNADTGAITERDRDF